MLADISLYWFTGAIGSSFWPYYARLHGSAILPRGRDDPGADGYAQFPREILKPPRTAAARVFTDIRRWEHHAQRVDISLSAQPTLPNSLFAMLGAG